jgi:hypothetical protein
MIPTSHIKKHDLIQSIAHKYMLKCRHTHVSKMLYGSVKTLFLRIKYMGYVWTDIKNPRQIPNTQTTDARAS